MFLLWLRQLPWCGHQTPASVSPPAKGRSSPINTPVSPLVLSSYWVLRGPIYSFPLVRYSCPLSAGVLYALLCLRCVPHVSVERDVPDVHLLLHHLVYPPVSFFIIIVFAFSVILLWNLTQDQEWNSSSCCLFTIIWNWTLTTVTKPKIDSSLWTAKLKQIQPQS